MQEKLKQDCKQKILCDPFVTEASWLPACQESKFGLSTSKQGNLFKLPLAVVVALTPILTSIFVSVTGFCAIHLGFDWGYYLVQRFFGQTQGNNQGVAADIALFVIIAPLFFGLTMASFERVRQKHWSFAIPILTGLLWTENSIVNGSGSMGHLELLVYSGIASVFFFFGFALAGCIVKFLKSRIRIRALFATCISCITIMGLLSYFLAGKAGWFAEMLMYSAVLFGAGLFSSRSARVKNAPAALMIPIISTAPLMLTNFVNVLGTSVSLILDHFHLGLQLGWESLLSACIISTVALASTGAGGLLGFKLMRNSRRRNEAYQIYP